MARCKKEPGVGRVIALAGNPNVGKSTVFNALTGLRQHTGNWPGKTVEVARGRCGDLTLVDTPGAYSLAAHSAEEEVARDFICFGSAEAVIVVCDATAIERNLNLVLQVMEVAKRVVVCVNLMDEAARRGVGLDLEAISDVLSVPVVGCAARHRGTLAPLVAALAGELDAEPRAHYLPRYPEALEGAVSALAPALEAAGCPVPPRWAALRLIEGDEELISELDAAAHAPLTENGEVIKALAAAREYLALMGVDMERARDMIATSLVSAAEDICAGAVTYESAIYDRDRRIDRVLTGRLTGWVMMLLLLTLTLYLTIEGANYPSQWLAALFERLGERLYALFASLDAPPWLTGVLLDGAYRVLTFVVAVMLPPMAIFFPLFTLLEDAGYLPRVAYNLDGAFQKCGACGKQALTMCMSLGCTAAGVVGCRIIDSPRERLLAMLTAGFVPCNGRFPTLIAIIAMFLAIPGRGLLPAALLTAVIAFAVLATLFATKILASTVLRGEPSSFTLELPGYRAPQIGRVIVRSVLDRTLRVLGRAAIVAAPAGALLWLAANVTVGDSSLLAAIAAALDPLGRLMGMDGVILTAFILGFPANEIVLPIILMAYSAQGSIGDVGALNEVREALILNGWTWRTAACCMIFSLLHWPCSTTLMTVKRETGSAKWTLLAAIVPTALGAALCILITLFTNLIP